VAIGDRHQFLESAGEELSLCIAEDESGTTEAASRLVQSQIGGWIETGSGPRVIPCVL